MSLLVLDTSAITAYAHGSIDVGEPVSEVADSGGTVVLPVPCMIEAAARVGDDMPRMLAAHDACTVTPVPARLWPALAAGVRALGRLDLAAALVAASEGDGFILTGEPDGYGPLGADLVIPI